MSNLEFERERPAAPRVVVVGLASCFGCQLQITNAEPYLLDVLGQIDLRYWQLASSDPMPEEFDVAVIEGAATTAEAIETLKAVRKKASAVIAVGACATTAGIPGMAAGNVEAGAAAVYGEAGAPEACGELIDPAPSRHTLMSTSRCSAARSTPSPSSTCCSARFTVRTACRRRRRCAASAKHNDRGCFFGRGILCLGLVTRCGCGARCTSLGRPCNGCAGLSPDANVAAARAVCAESGVSVAAFDEALQMFNYVNPALSGASEE